MSVNDSTISSDSTVRSELLFLIARFLSNGPCKQAANALLQELQTHELFPKGYDWEGNPRTRTYDQLIRMHSHLGSDYLLQICQRLGPLLDQLVPTNTHGIRSLLGAGKMSLLRTPESVKRTKWNLSHQMVLQNGCPRLKPDNVIQQSMVQSLQARHTIGAGMTSYSIPTSVYAKMTMHDRKLGHLSAVYCVSYDRTGQYIITGADDALAKIWHAQSGRLLATLRGHASEITDMAVNYENTLLATGSMDKFVRVWCLRTKAPVAVLYGHTGNITTVQFSPQCKGDVRLLISSGSDGSICFWLWNVATNYFNPKPKKFVERSHAGAQMLCTSFSPGGTFLATGNSDHVIRVYFFYASEPNKICELEAHTNKVDSICYSNVSNRFVSGSEDGTARIWRYERQEWRATILDMATKLNSDGTSVIPEESSRPEENLRVTMVSWNLDDSLVITAVSDFSIKVWDSYTGHLRHVLQAHEDEVFVLDSNPKDPRILLSAGHDGNIILWDITTGVKIKSFFNNIQGQGHGAVYDCKFTPDGQSFAATDSHGQLLFFGFGFNEEIQKIPQEVFFHTDYRPLIRDASNYVLDEQTQQPPHLMPPPFLVNIDGNPYPAILQRLVPGRENMKEAQLVPEIAINEAGDSEVIGDQDNDQAVEIPSPEQHSLLHLEVPVRSAHAESYHRQDHDYSRQQGDDLGISDEAQSSEDTDSEDGGHLGRIDERTRPSIDEMIRQLQQEQDERILAEGGELPVASPPPPPAPAPPEVRIDRPRSLEGRVGMRRIGELEGVRQSLGNMQQVATWRDLAAWKKRVLIKPLTKAVLKTTEEKRLAFAQDETNKYILERKKKQSVPNTPSTLFGNMSRGKQQQLIRSQEKKKVLIEQTARNRLTTRALYDTEEEDEEEEEEAMDTEQSDHNSEESSYSDWTMEGSSNLQPPKRRSQRKPKRRQISSSEDEDDDDELDMESDEEDDDNGGDDDNDEEYKAYKKHTKRVAEKAEESKEEEKKKVLTVPKPKKLKKALKKSKEISRNNLPVITELKEEFRPPEWLTGTIPRKTPYVPQMGDEIMYFRQGHELYLQAVERHKTYEINASLQLPWQKNPHLREMELVKIVGIRYEVKPPRLCNLKLAYINADTGKMSGGSFSIRYHDMPDVIDFLVLRQHFDIAFKRHWKPGNRFRSMIDDQWWMGKIESQGPLNMRFPDSMFQCFLVHWDNGEFERLSPWDMEPINESLLPSNIGGGVPVDPEELKELLYTPKVNEWSSAGREVETERILTGLEAIMEHSAAEPFNAPVDLNAFPVYAMIIEYPIDLSTIKARLENGYYRRINALQWDVRHIEINAKKFNEDGTPISRSAGIVTETLLRFISDPNCQDPMPILEELSRGQEFSWSGGEDGKEEGGDGSNAASKRKQGEDGDRRSKRQPQPDPNAWKKQCADLLALMLECEDAGPFKEPVDPEHYPNYHTIIETPMDFGKVESKLSRQQYTSPVDFAKDVRLIFHNSRTFNTNKRSRIFSMTLRLSAMFEERMQKIISSWRSVSKSKSFAANSGRSALPTSIDRMSRPVSNSQGKEPNLQALQSARTKFGASNISKLTTSGKSADERLRTTITTKESDSETNGQVETESTAGEKYKSRTRRFSEYSDLFVRRTLAKPVVDSDSDRTEVEDEGRRGTRRSRHIALGKQHYNEDEETEIEEEDSEVSTPPINNRLSANTATNKSKCDSDLKSVSNGHTSYRTRAKTGSLRPKRYLSSGDEEEKDVCKNGKRAPSYSSRESSLHLPDEDDDEDESSSKSETSVDSENSHRKRKKKPKTRNRKAATKRRQRNSRMRRQRELSSGDEDDDSDEGTEESESESESEEEQSHKPKPKRRSNIDLAKSSSIRKHSGSGKRTTRNQGKRTCNYLEDSYDDCEDDPSCLSVSSRGRVRKLTKRARANRIDD